MNHTIVCPSLLFELWMFQYWLVNSLATEEPLSLAYIYVMNTRTGIQQARSCSQPFAIVISLSTNNSLSGRLYRSHHLGLVGSLFPYILFKHHTQLQICFPTASLSISSTIHLFPECSSGPQTFSSPPFPNCLYNKSYILWAWFRKPSVSLPITFTAINQLPYTQLQ